MTSRRLFLITLALSLAAHLAVLGSGVLPDISLAPPPEQKLEKIDVTMQALAMDEPPPPKTATAQLIAARPAKPARAETAAKTKAKAEASQAQAERAPVEASAPLAEAAAGEPATASSAPAEEKPVSSAPVAEQVASDDAAEASPTEDAADDAAAKPQTGPGPDGYIRPRQALKDFPKTAVMGYQAYWGSVLAGSGQLDWRRGNGGYRLEVRFSPVIGPKLRYVSQGGLSRRGLAPDSLQAYRNDQPRESARFDWQAGQLRFGDKGDKQTELRAGAQDVFSLAFQLGLKGGKLGSEAIQITTGKKVYEYPLVPGEGTEYDTGAGKIRVIVFRAEGDGDVNEFWLAPDFANLPVRILRIDKDKRIDLRAMRIDVNGKAEWLLPPQPTIRNKNAH
nr:DUF3108 domain-containing protein [Chromobacterium sp. ASV5]